MPLEKTDLRSHKDKENDYTVVKQMLTSISTFEYSTSFILSQQIIRLLLIELEYWHDYALSLKDKTHE